MKKYEVMYIIRPNLENEGIKELIENIGKIFTERDSKILETKEIGLKDLAYEITGFRKGFYVWYLVEANNEAILEFSRVARINEDIIRDIVIKK